MHGEVRQLLPAFFTKTDYVLALVMLATLFALLVDFKLIRADQMFGDSAMYFQAVQNMAKRGVAVSRVSAGIDDGYKAVTMSADEIARNPSAVSVEADPAAERNLFRGHAYFVLYPIALLGRVFPLRTVLMALYVLSYIGMVLIAYLALRRRAVPAAAAALFCVLVAMHPAWGYGLLGSQFYPGRLFVLAGFGLMILASSPSGSSMGTMANRSYLALAAVASASINERAAIVAGLFVVLYSLLYWKSTRDHYFRIGLGSILFIYGCVALKVIQSTNTDYGSFLPTSLGSLQYLVQQTQFLQLNALFLIVTAPLLILAAFEWRAALIAVLLMLLNISGNIGVAEKIGWSTHYPSFYIPSLVFAAMLGYSALWQRATNYGRIGVCGALGLFVAFLAMLNPYAFPIEVKSSNVSNTFFAGLHYDVAQYIFKRAPRDSLLSAADGVILAVPLHTMVSSVQAAMPLLYNDRLIDLFPGGLDNADYAVLGATRNGDQIQYGGATGYRGPDEQARLDALVLAQMKRDGYDLSHPALFPAFNGLAVVRHIRRGT